jgi:hypothetical protein
LRKPPFFVIPVTGNKGIYLNVTWHELDPSPRREHHNGVMIYVKERYLAVFLPKNEKYL